MKKINKLQAKKAWEKVAKELAEDSPIKFGVLEDFVFDSYSNGVIGIAIPHSASSVKDTMFWPHLWNKLNDRLNKELGTDVSLFFPIQDADPVNYQEYNNSCDKPCDAQEGGTFRIVWDHEISEKIFELEAKILTYTIIGGATLFVSICNLVALIIKK